MTEYKTAETAINNLYSGVVVKLAGFDSAIFFQAVGGQIFAFAPALGICEHPKTAAEIKAHFETMLKEGASLYKLEV